jgi:hypothetical protein
MGGVVTKPGIVTSVVETADASRPVILDAAKLAGMLDEAKRASDQYARGTRTSRSVAASGTSSRSSSTTR